MRVSVLRTNWKIYIVEIDERLQALENVANSTNLPALDARLDKIEALVKTIEEKLQHIEVLQDKAQAAEKQEVYDAEGGDIKDAYILLVFIVIALTIILHKFLPKIYEDFNPSMLIL